MNWMFMSMKTMISQQPALNAETGQNSCKLRIISNNINAYPVNMSFFWILINSFKSDLTGSRLRHYLDSSG
jgi:hypothetical protein